MGDPKGVTTGPPLIDSGNGIFVQVPGEYIASASYALPLAEALQGQTATVETDDGFVGRVVITYLSKELHHRRKRRWCWVATLGPPGVSPHRGHLTGG